MSHKLNPLGFILCVVQIRQNYLVFNVNSILFHRVIETKPLKGVKKCLLIRNLLISSGTRIYNIKCVNARKTSFKTCQQNTDFRFQTQSSDCDRQLQHEISY
ncbi:Hypothetical_protein [Hexamita inflata]|uniref:Hypothetical_protein n=1 Tax=Hexamita inflata TaxID=28002 RepID=A0AA86QQP7_9EUKA|nr:Hypothetical protein HINF_LOCUS48897 [Hexamita inflata]